MTLETGFMMAASADIFCLVMLLPAAKSTIAIWPNADSQMVMNLSDSIVQDPNLMFSAATLRLGFVSYQYRVRKVYWCQR